MWGEGRGGWVGQQHTGTGELLVERETLCDVTGTLPGSIYFII